MLAIITEYTSKAIPGTFDVYVKNNKCVFPRSTKDETFLENITYVTGPFPEHANIDLMNVLDYRSYFSFDKCLVTNIKARPLYEGIKNMLFGGTKSIRFNGIEKVPFELKVKPKYIWVHTKRCTQGDKMRVNTPLTEEERKILDEAFPQGQTALFDAVRKINAKRTYIYNISFAKEFAAYAKLEKRHITGLPVLEAFFQGVLKEIFDTDFMLQQGRHKAAVIEQDNQYIDCKEAVLPLEELKTRTKFFTDLNMYEASTETTVVYNKTALKKKGTASEGEKPMYAYVETPSDGKYHNHSEWTSLGGVKFLKEEPPVDNELGFRVHWKHESSTYALPYTDRILTELDEFYSSLTPELQVELSNDPENTAYCETCGLYTITQGCRCGAHQEEHPEVVNYSAFWGISESSMPSNNEDYIDSFDDLDGADFANRFGFTGDLIDAEAEYEETGSEETEEASWN